MGSPKGGRRKGYRMSPESRARTSAAMRRHFERRRPWLEVSREILAAANAGDREKATALLNTYLDKHVSIEMNQGGGPQESR